MFRKIFFFILLGGLSHTLFPMDMDQELLDLLGNDISALPIDNIDNETLRDLDASLDAQNQRLFNLMLDVDDSLKGDLEERVRANFALKKKITYRISTPQIVPTIPFLNLSVPVEFKKTPLLTPKKRVAIKMKERKRKWAEQECTAESTVNNVGMSSSFKDLKFDLTADSKEKEKVYAQKKEEDALGIRCSEKTTEPAHKRIRVPALGLQGWPEHGSNYQNSLDFFIAKYGESVIRKSQRELAQELAARVELPGILALIRATEFTQPDEKGKKEFNLLLKRSFCVLLEHAMTEKSGKIREHVPAFLSQELVLYKNLPFAHLCHKADTAGMKKMLTDVQFSWSEEELQVHIKLTNCLVEKSAIYDPVLEILEAKRIEITTSLNTTFHLEDVAPNTDSSKGDNNN